MGRRIFSAIVISILLAFALYSAVSIAQFAGCCCNLANGTSYEGRTSEMEYEDCPPNYNIIIRSPIDIYENKSCIDVCAARAGTGGGGGKPPVGNKCGDAGYTPAPTNLRATNIKGEKQIRLVWDAECPVDYFKVSRCDGYNCNDFEVLSSQITLSYYADSEPSLLWDQDYTYQVIAHYNLQGDSSSAVAVANTGDIECSKQLDSSKFCISSVFYSKFADYFKTHGYKLTPAGNFYTNFTGAVRNQFFDKLNKAFFCDADNKLSSPDDICSRQGMPGGICVSDAGEVSCIAPSQCESLDSEGLFGLYSSVESCEGASGSKKYCYFDRSKSIIDKCYPCSQDMSCYNYRTRSTCERDSCGLGECDWKDIYPEINIGVCFDRRFSACYLCDQVPIGPNYEGFNTIFEQCSEEKSSALASPEYPCYWRNWKSLSCDEVSCMTYLRKSECGSPTSGIQLYANNSIKTRSTDTCNVGVCQWRPDEFDASRGECLKNADANTGLWPDCTFAEDKAKCELDYVPPDTTIVSTGALGVYDKLHINIFDKISRTDPGEYKTGSKILGYPTYFCHYPEGSTKCNVHDSPISTNVGTLTLNYLTLHNTAVIETQTKIAELSPGWNIITYYSKDPSNNPGIVKDVRVFACQKCTGPQIINFYMEDEIQIGGKYYTNSRRPVFHADFNVEAEVTVAEIDFPDGTLASYTTLSTTGNMNYTLMPETGLTEGRYKIRINAKDSEGTFMNVEWIREFIVDYTAGAINITVDGKPAEGALITKSKADIGIIFAEQAPSLQVFMNENEVTGYFARQQGGASYLARNLALDEGVITLAVVGKDVSGNTMLGSATFEVNALPPTVKLRYPAYGVANSFKFNITAETQNRVNCRFLYDVPIPVNFSYTDLEPFDTTDGQYHIINEFTRIPDGDYENHTLHVFCLDPLWGMGNATFNIYVDTTPPIIKTAYADPQIIKEALAENTYGTLFKVGANEKTFCKYSDSIMDYDQMPWKFPGYKVEPHIAWPNSKEVPKLAHIQQVNVTEQNRSYTYFTSCEDLAGWKTSPMAVGFSVDLSIPFNVTDHTIPPIYKNSSSVVLAVETNKRAYCFYGKENSSITNSFQNDGEYSHTTSIVNLPLGKNTLLVQCFTKYQTPKETSAILPIIFTVDTTSPAMIYVNDTGPLPNEPDYSYFKNELRARWLGYDNESPVTRYYYMIETFYGKVSIINWTLSTIGGDIVPTTGLNLTDDTTYRFRVMPENGAGLMGAVMDSDGVTVDFDKMPQSCNDSVLAGIPNETDIDCGGICPGCAEGMKCVVNIDCLSRFCDNITGTCKAPACNDLAVNGLETDIDCGGTNCSKCIINQKCISNNDCQSGNCLNGLCAEADPCFNEVMDGTETGVDCGGSCANACGIGSSCMTGADCESGLCANGLCIPRKKAGESCENDTECEPGLICKDGRCAVPKKEEGGSCASDSECYDGFLCFEGRCSKDSDGDGMPDEWELRYGLDPFNPADALFDSDNDGISNVDEYRRGTDPSSYDSDGDRWGDGQELDFGTDPLDSSSRPSAWLGIFYHPLGYWWLWFIILVILALVAVLSFYGYNAYQEMQKKKEKEKQAAKKPSPEKPATAAPQRALTAEEKKLLEKEAKTDKEIAAKLEKVKGLIQKKAGTKEEMTKKEWMGIDELVVPFRKAKPEMEPVFKKLDSLKKGKLGARGREKALQELEKLLGSKAVEVKEGALAKEKIAKQKKASTFERLSALAKSAKGKREKEERDPLMKLKMIALTALSPAERKEILEKLVLLRTGKLSADERKELFDKLREAAEYYKKHRQEIEAGQKPNQKRKKVKKK